MHLKMSAKWWPFCPGGDELMPWWPLLGLLSWWPFIDLNHCNYRKTSNISHTLVGISRLSKIVDNSDVVAASPVGAAPTTSSFST